MAEGQYFDGILWFCFPVLKCNFLNNFEEIFWGLKSDLFWELKTDLIFSLKCIKE